MHRVLFATLAIVVGLVAPSNLKAASGIKATATVSKRVSADLLIVSFHLIERSHPETQSRLREEEARIRDELGKTGATILSWTGSVGATNAGFNSTTFNYINPSSTENQAVDTRRNVTVRLSKVSDVEVISAVLGRNAVRHGVTFQWSSTQSEKARDELALEAVAAAVEKARRYATSVGAKTGSVLDLAVSHTGAPIAAPEGPTSTRTSITFYAAPSEHLVEDDQGRGLLVYVTAYVTLQARPD
jgi:predicted secreted protein